MRTQRGWITTLFLAWALAGCAAHAERLKATASGYPEGVFKNAEMDAIRSKVIEGCNKRGYVIAEASTNTVICQKETAGMEEVAARLMVGNSYSTTPFKKLRATLYKVDADVKVTLSLTMETQMPFGQVRAEPLNTSDAFNEMQKALFELGTV
jgi:hypothetical protein